MAPTTAARGRVTPGDGSRRTITASARSAARELRAVAMWAPIPRVAGVGRGHSLDTLLERQGNSTAIA